MLSVHPKQVLLFIDYAQIVITVFFLNEILIHSFFSSCVLLVYTYRVNCKLWQQQMEYVTSQESKINANIFHMATNTLRHKHNLTWISFLFRIELTGWATCGMDGPWWPCILRINNSFWRWWCVTYVNPRFHLHHHQQGQNQKETRTGSMAVVATERAAAAAECPSTGCRPRDQST